MPGKGAYRVGRYRLRTWLRGHELQWLYDRWPIPKGSIDCGNHEFYRSDDQVDRCYHVEIGTRPNDYEIIGRARLLLADGATQDQIISMFREAGLTFIRSVRALSIASGTSVGEAKAAVHWSDAWASERSDREEFWTDLEQHVDRDSA